MKPIGLIAAAGDLPVATAKGIHAAGLKVACVGLRELVEPVLAEDSDMFCTAGIAQVGRWIRKLRSFGVTEAILVGKVHKVRMHKPFAVIRHLPDLRTIKIYFFKTRHDKRPDAMLRALADELSDAGITLIDSTKYIPELMADEGVMTRTKPSSQQMADIEFALPIVSRMGDLDIGQAVAIKERDVIAVEAIEGTDAMIQRAGELCQSGKWVCVKIAKPNQDMRFDVPTVGPGTIDSLRAAGAGCLAVEAGRTILLEKESFIEQADRAGIAVVGVVLDQKN